MTDDAKPIRVRLDKVQERRDRLGDGWRADEIVVADPREARDRTREPASGVSERREALADRDLADLVEADPCRADLDDAVALRIEAGSLQVKGYEALLRVPALLAAAGR